MNNKQRAGADNAIWLCHTCSVLIDRDPARYSVDLLRIWKQNAEDRARRQIGLSQGDEVDSLNEPTPPPIPLDSTSLHRYIKKSLRVRHYDLQIAKSNRLPLENYDSDGLSLLEHIRSHRINDLAELDRCVEVYGEVAVKIATSMSMNRVSEGSILMFALETLACDHLSLDEHVDHHSQLTMTSSSRGFTEELRKTYDLVTRYDW